MKHKKTCPNCNHVFTPENPHGTIQRYAGEKCRCDACREAARIYKAEHRKKKPADDAPGS